jgi:hypothetical protein
MISNNSNGLNQLSLAIYLEKLLDRGHLVLLDFVCIRLVKRLSLLKSCKKKLLKPNKFMFSFCKMSFLFWVKNHILILLELLIY